MPSAKTCDGVLHAQSAIAALSDERSIALKQLILTGRKWRSGTLSVCFFQGSDAIRGRIAAVAREWNAATPRMQLNFGRQASPPTCGTGGPYDIRVDLNSDYYSSDIGESHSRNQTFATMHLGRMLTAPPEDEGQFRHLVLHEFGHALGLLHEMKHPDVRCDEEMAWAALLQKYRERYGSEFSEDRVRSEFKRIANFEIGVSVEVLPFDSNSVMLYSFPEGCYHRRSDSSCYADLNTVLAPADREAVRRLYERPPTASTFRLAEEAARAGMPAAQAYLSLDMAPPEHAAAALRIYKELKASDIGAVSPSHRLREALTQASENLYGVD